MILCKILLRHNAEIFIERDLLVRNAEFLRPDFHAHPLRKQYYEKRDDSDKLKLDTIDDED